MRRFLTEVPVTAREKELNHLLWVNVAVIVALVAVLLLLRA